MSLVVACCCEEVGPPQPCPCQCVCDYAWYFRNITDQYPASYNGSLYGGTHGQNPLLDHEEWTLLYWINGCEPFHGEFGSLWHTYTEDGPPTFDENTPITPYLWMNVEDLGSPNQFETQFLFTDENGEKDAWQAELVLDSDALPTLCKMITLQYRRVTDAQNRTVPQIRFRMRYNLGAVGEPVVIGEKDYFELFIPDPGFEGQDWSLDIPDDAKTWIGAQVPRCDDYHNTLFREFDGCMSNLHIYNRWLDDTEYEDAWNNFEGLLDSTAWERWCPTFDFCEEDQIGAIRGIRLESHCPIKDEDGDLIEDQNNRCIFSRP